MIVNTASAVPSGMCKQLIAETTKENVLCFLERMKIPDITFKMPEATNQIANTT
jgi:cytidine deaminase